MSKMNAIETIDINEFTELLELLLKTITMSNETEDKDALVRLILICLKNSIKKKD